MGESKWTVGRERRGGRNGGGVEGGGEIDRGGVVEGEKGRKEREEGGLEW